MQQNKLYIIENIQNSTVCVFLRKKTVCEFLKHHIFISKILQADCILLPYNYL